MVQVSNECISHIHLYFQATKGVFVYFNAFHLTHSFLYSLMVRWYKTPDDKPLNGLGFDEKYLNAAESEKVIAETHEAWKKLKAGEAEAGKLWVN